MSTLKQKLSDHCDVVKNLENHEKEINNFITIITKKITKGGKLLFCGKGGSAADAQHLAAEMLVRLRPHISRLPLPAISLATDTSTLTACGNDYSFDQIFERSFLALHKKNDVLFVISTSGKSKNIIKVLRASKKNKITSLALLGKNGGGAKAVCDRKIIVNSQNTALIQEAHILLGHYILEKVEDNLIKKKILNKI